MSDSFGSSVWDRASTGREAMSKNAFAALVSFWIAAGIAGSAIVAHGARALQPGLGTSLAVLVVAIIGIVIALRSENPFVSLLGYAMVVLPFGFILGPFVAQYSNASVEKIFFVTAAMVVALGVVGAAIPHSLEGWGSWLFSGLIVLLIGSFALPIAGMFGIPIVGALTALDWVGVVLFSGYIVYDWNLAMRVERTHDNAIDCALALYLDIVNLFIRLLQLFGSRSHDVDFD